MGCYIYTYAHPFAKIFIHSFVDGHSGYFHVLALVNNTAKTMGRQTSFQEPVFTYFGYVLRSSILKSFSISIS